MNDNLKTYLERPYSTYVLPDETTHNELCYIAYHPELPGCMSHGSTPEEALNNLQEATALFISTLLDMNLDIPEPMSTQVIMEISLPSKTYTSEPSSISSISLLREADISESSSIFQMSSISKPIFNPVP